MFSYKRASDRAIAVTGSGKVLYIHDKFDLPRVSGNKERDEKAFKDM